jgi:hypothetical protein
MTRTLIAAACLAVAACAPHDRTLKLLATCEHGQKVWVDRSEQRWLGLAADGSMQAVDEHARLRDVCR